MTTFSVEDQSTLSELKKKIASYKTYFTIAKAKPDAAERFLMLQDLKDDLKITETDGRLLDNDKVRKPFAKSVKTITGLSYQTSLAINTIFSNEMESFKASTFFNIAKERPAAKAVLETVAQKAVSPVITASARAKQLDNKAEY